VAVNPLVLFTQDETQHINPSSWQRPAVWDTAANSFGDKKRILNDTVTQPYVDDFYRADNRWGPKPKYDKTYPIPVGKTIGDDIGAITKLTDGSEGLDGYWERQATQKGLRLIVGQRLELGNANGWNVAPPGTGTITPPPPGVIRFIRRLVARLPWLPPITPLAATTNICNAKPCAITWRRCRAWWCITMILRGVEGFLRPVWPSPPTPAPARPLWIVAALVPGWGQPLRLKPTFSMARAPTAGSLIFMTQLPLPLLLGLVNPWAMPLETWPTLPVTPRVEPPPLSLFKSTDVHPFPYMAMWGDFSPCAGFWMATQPTAP
jgi:hypothetical protein